MSIPVWPADPDLPQLFRKDGYSAGLGDGRISAQADKGLGKAWGEWSSYPDPVAGTMRMTAAQLARVQAFFKDDTINGTLPFTFPSQTDDGMWLVKFDPASPPPAGAPLRAGLYSVRIALIILP